MQTKKTKLKLTFVIPYLKLKSLRLETYLSSLTFYLFLFNNVLYSDSLTQVCMVTNRSYFFAVKRKIVFFIFTASIKVDSLKVNKF